MIAWMLYTVVVATLLAVAALATEESARLLRRPQRWGWMGAMVAAVALPLLLRLLPARPAPASGAASMDPEALAALLAHIPDEVSAPGIFDALLSNRAADTPLIIFWLLAAAVMTGVLVATYARTLELRAGARRIRIAGVPALLTRAAGPMVVGVRRPEVVVPQWIDTLSEDEKHLVVRHEWEHVKACDTRLLLASAVLVAAMPWNVPLWWMRRRLRQALEVDCDARVLATGANRGVYGRMLIRTAGRPGPTSVLAPALVELPSMLERRIIAMTAKSPAYRPLRLAICASVGALLFVAACELTPRGGALGPTEPTLADVLSPETVDVDFTVVLDSAGAGATQERPLEIVYVTTLDEGDSVRTLVSPVRRITTTTLDTGDAEPIYMVDDVQVESIAGVAPSTISRIEVVKGPAAVTRFGPEAISGVVRVTTGEPTEVSTTTGTISPRVQTPPAVAHESGTTVRIRGARDVSEVTVPAPARASASVTPARESVAVVGYRSAEPASVSSITSPRAVTVGPAAADGVTSADAAPRQIHIRGATATTEPLVVIDGRPADSLDGIDPSTIESIAVLKGDAAVERWGARGRYGVIEVTIKK